MELQILKDVLVSSCSFYPNKVNKNNTWAPNNVNMVAVKKVNKEGLWKLLLHIHMHHRRRDE